MLFNFASKGLYIIAKQFRKISIPQNKKTLSPKRNHVKGSYNFEIVSYFYQTHV